MPRYEIRRTSDNARTYVEGDLPLDLFLSQAAGTYRARVMSAEEPTDIVVPTLTAGSIVQTTPTVGDTLTVTGSNAPTGSTFLWEVDTGSGFGAAGGTNNATSYDTTGRPGGDYRRGVSTPGQSMVFTSAVTVSSGQAPGLDIVGTAKHFYSTENTNNPQFTVPVPGSIAGNELAIFYSGPGGSDNVSGFTVDGVAAINEGTSGNNIERRMFFRRYVLPATVTSVVIAPLLTAARATHHLTVYVVKNGVYQTWGASSVTAGTVIDFGAGLPTNATNIVLATSHRAVAQGSHVWDSTGPRNPTTTLTADPTTTRHSAARRDNRPVGTNVEFRTTGDVVSDGVAAAVIYQPA